jgi:hypothetical protein
MVVVGVIEDPVKLKAIIDWAAEQQSTLPKLRCPQTPQAYPAIPLVPATFRLV